MKYLTIDTTTKTTALSLAQDGKLIGEGFLHTEKTHSERLVPMMDQLLHAADWKLEELGFIGVVRGPGSFTGIRIGIATAQGLAHVLKIPLIGMTSLDTLAWAGYGRTEDTVVILDARKNEWYYARYRWTESRETIQGPMAIRPDVLIPELRQYHHTYFFVGDAVLGATRNIKEALGEKAVISLPYQHLPRGAYGACEAWKQWNRDLSEENESQDLCTIEPFYIRLSEAEVNYQKKHLENS